MYTRNTMKLSYMLTVVAIMILVIFLLLRGFNGGEDNWIKDSKGIWIKHGNPSSTPNEVLVQQNAIACANDLYQKAKQSNMQFTSQCLGTCSDYSVDIVHVPRIAEDNEIENQCLDYRNKVTKYFIELDKDGNIIRVVE